MEKSSMTESKDQRKGWLKDLKVGDKVFIVVSKGVLGTKRVLTTVEKITPTGRIDARGTRFPPTGKIYANYVFTELEQATEQTIQEHVTNIKKQRIINELTAKFNSGVLKKMDLLDLEVALSAFSKYE